VLNRSPFPIHISARGLWRAGQRAERADPSKGVARDVEISLIRLPGDPPDAVPALQERDFVIPFDSQGLPADHYSVDAQLSAVPLTPLVVPEEMKGKVRLANATFDTLPLSADVRDAAFVPVLLVLLGVALGRLFSLMRSPSIVARLALYKQTNVLRMQVRHLNDPAAQAGLNGEIDSLWSSFGVGAMTLQEFQDALTDVAKKIAALRQQDDVMDAATARGVPGPALNAMTLSFQQARGGLLQRGLATAALASNDLGVKAYNTATGQSLPTATAAAHSDALNARQSPKTRIFARFFGIDTTLRNTAWLYKYGKPLVYFLLICAVALSGAFSQYAARAAEAHFHTIARQDRLYLGTVQREKLADRQRAQGGRQLRAPQKLSVPVPHGRG
jgi:hypothetical protein